jgi:RHS repeat-associated protein
MKYIKIIPILFILFSAYKSKAQSHIVLNSPDSGNKEYRATQEILLQNGYHYNALNTMMRAYIDDAIPGQTSYDNLYTSSSFDGRQINTNLTVGYTPGAFDVSSSGAATYFVPIMVPSGSSELVPKLGIAYNSQSGNGLLGMGWNIAGLSAITRTNKSIYFNNEVSPVKLDNSDPFQMDGQYLQVISGSNGGNNTVYATESESYSKITSYQSAGKLDWFKVETKTGVIMEFGHTDDSKFILKNSQEVLIWRINKIIDQFGNYIVFTYRNENSQSRIHEISYTGNSSTGLLPYNKINFYYDVKDDSCTRFVNGNEVADNLLLNRIVIKADDVSYKTYFFKYGKRLYSFLNEIQEAGSNGSKFNSTIFKYGDQLSNITVESSITPNNRDLLSGDFNGDGKSDILALTHDLCNGNDRCHTSYELLLNSGSGFTQTSTGNFNAGTTVWNKAILTDKIGVLKSDFNGDGLLDFITTKTELYVYNHPSNTNLLTELQLYTSTGTAFNISNLPIGGSNNGGISGFISTIQNNIIPGDFNGDGADDLISLISDVPGTWVGYICNPKLSLTNYTINNFSSGLASSISSADKIYVIDFDGDGKDELMVVDNNNTKVYTFSGAGSSTSISVIYDAGYPTKWHEFITGDFNGDGITDLLSSGNGTNWNIAYGTGLHWQEQSISFYPTPDLSNVYEHFNIADLNGDGKSDIYHSYGVFVNGVSTSSEIQVYSFYGDGYEKTTHTYPYVLGAKMEIGDFNGDGKLDILDQNYYASPVRIIYFNKDAHLFSLVKISNGFNNVTEINHDLITNNSIYIKGSASGFPLVDYQRSLRVVAQAKNNDGIGGVKTSNYTYEAALFHTQGKGFLGFKKLTTSHVSDNVKNVKEFNLNTSYYQPYIVSDRFYVYNDNKPTESKLFTFNFTSLGGKRFKQELTSTLLTDEITGWTNSKTSTFDNFGNVLVMAETNGVESCTTTCVYGSAYGTWIPSSPTSILISKQRGTNPIYSRITNNAYDSKGAITNTTIDPGKSKSVSMEYLYDKYGNTIKITKSSAGITSQIEKYAFDVKGRFLIEKTNQLNQVEKLEYDVRWGLPKKNVSINGKETFYEYDAFGRVTEVVLPNGVSATNKFNWDIGNFNYNGTLPIQFNSSIYSIVSESNNASDLKKWYDMFGRVIKISTEHPSGNDVVNLINFDKKGNQSKLSEPFFTNGSPQNVTINSYDDFNRLTTSQNANRTVAYSYTVASNLLRTQISDGSQWRRTFTDASGKIVQSEDNGGTLFNTYNSIGLLKKVELNGIVLTEMEYDIYGQQVKLVDANAGTSEFEYNAFGQLINEKDGNNNTFQMQYDGIGRISIKSGPTGNTTYEYVTENNGLNQLKKMVAPNGISQEYTYDKFGRITTDKQIIYTQTLETNYTYDNYGNNTSITFPSGFRIDYVYDSKGNMIKAKDPSANVIFNNPTFNQYGKYISYELGNGITTYQTYNQYGILSKSKAGNIFDMEYTFDPISASLTKREDKIKNLYEVFEYDDLDRLSLTKLGTNGQKTLGYQSNGNIQHQTEVGWYIYNNSKPNALEKITSTQNEVRKASPQTHQTVTYTSFDRTATISENDYLMTFSYGPDENRKMSEMKFQNNILYTRYYSEIYEKQVAGSNSKEIHYIPLGQNVTAIYVIENGTGNMRYVYKDYLGSILTVTNNQGAVIAEQSFDARGKYRNPNDWTFNSIPTVPDWLYRGYTGHEHYREFTLINMNNRMYDPEVARMLAPDNFISDPFNSQAYNRYSYALNNPLKYTDGDGEIPILIPILIGAAIGGYQGYQIAEATGADGWKFGAYVVGGAVIGAGAGYIGATIAASGGIMTTTLGAVGGSFVSSVGFGAMGGVAGINVPMTISYGIGSFSLNNGPTIHKYLFKKGNKKIENVGYFFGALGNLSDLIAGINGINVKLITEHSDGLGHASITGDGGNISISVGPGVTPYYGGVSGFFNQVKALFREVKGNGNWDTHAGAGEISWHLPINNINKTILTKITNNLQSGKNIVGNPLIYAGAFRSCVSYASRALWCAGIPNIGIHPFLLHASILTRQLGLYISPQIPTASTF